MTRIAIIVSHPIQYYAPLYQRLAARFDTTLKVFFTWHGGERPVVDNGFKIPVAWDIPLASGYDYEVVPNTARDPGTHHFSGLQNPSLIRDVLSWRPDVVHLTGWNWWSHLAALRAFKRGGIPVLFRGDSHLLDETRGGLKWQLKRAVLSQVYSWPSAFLVVGKANRRYYEAFGVGADRLYLCPHSIDVQRFSSNDARLEHDAYEWRAQLQIGTEQFVVLFAGKFEKKKRPVELMRAVEAGARDDVVMVMVGGGQLEPEIRALAAGSAKRFRLLPFQNQSRMPVVYRLGDVFVLPSQYGETWGLAVNEAMACGRSVIVSNRVGCAEDVVDGSCGHVFPWDDVDLAVGFINQMAKDRSALPKMRTAAIERAGLFNLVRTEDSLLSIVRKLSAR